jgi:hypothetical protein
MSLWPQRLLRAAIVRASILVALRVELRLLPTCLPGQGGGPERDDAAGPAIKRAAIVNIQRPGAIHWR